MAKRIIEHLFLEESFGWIMRDSNLFCNPLVKLWRYWRSHVEFLISKYELVQVIRNIY